MNYIELINRFWSIDLEANFSHLEVHLFFKLLEINNKLGWKERFKFPNSRLEAEIGSRQKNLINARQRLVDNGVLVYKKGSTRDAGSYTIIPDYFQKYMTKESNKESNEGSNQGCNTGSNTGVIKGTLNKQNKTKQEKESGGKTANTQKPISERASDFKSEIWKVAKGTDFENVSKLKEFWEYWSEHSPDDKKMRFEKQTSFDIARRLGTWWRNSEKFDVPAKKNGLQIGQILQQDGYKSKVNF